MKTYTIYDYKAGNITDLEYYRHNYAGEGGSVKRFTSPRLKKFKKPHYFYVIKRPLVDYDGCKYTEFKVYDDEEGFLYKTRKYVDRNQSLEDFWNDAQNVEDLRIRIKWLFERKW